MNARAEGRPQDKPHHPHWPLGLVVGAFVFALGWDSVHAPETWVHLRTGGLILETGALPRADPFSWGAAGAPWTTDSWLSEVLFAKLAAAGGPGALVALKALATAAAFVLLLPINHGCPLTAAGVLALGALAAWTGMTETPAIFDLPLFALFTRLLRPRRRFEWIQGVAAVVLTALWANLHGSSALLALWLVGLKVFKASLRTTARERAAYWATLLACALAVSWNPHGWAVLGRSFSDAALPAGGWVASWNSLYGALWLAAAAACWFTLQQEFVTTLAAATALSLALVLPGLRPLAALAACPVIALALGHWMKPLQDTWPRVAKAALVGVTLAWGHHRLIGEPLGHARGYGAARLRGAAHFLKANGVKGRLFNEPDAGAELIGHGAGPVFADRRAGVYPEGFLRDAEAWPGTFRTLDGVYRFDAAVVLNRRAGAPARVLDEDPAWRLAYADDGALVYLKSKGANAWLLAGPAPRLTPNRLWPDSLDALTSDSRRGAAVLEELDRWIVQSPDSAQALLWKAYALHRLGLGDKADRHLELAAWRSRRDPELSALRGFVLAARGRVDEALASYDLAADRARRLGLEALAAEVEPRRAALRGPAAPGILGLRR